MKIDADFIALMLCSILMMFLIYFAIVIFN